MMTFTLKAVFPDAMNRIGNGFMKHRFHLPSETPEGKGERSLHLWRFPTTLPRNGNTVTPGLPLTVAQHSSSRDGQHRIVRLSLPRISVGMPPLALAWVHGVPVPYAFPLRRFSMYCIDMPLAS